MNRQIRHDQQVIMDLMDSRTVTDGSVDRDGNVVIHESIPGSIDATFTELRTMKITHANYRRNLWK